MFNVYYYVQILKFLHFTSYLFQCNRLDSSENIKKLINNWTTLNSTAFSKVYSLLHS